MKLQAAGRTEPQMHAAILKSPNHLQSGAIADVTEPFESMTAKSALQDVAIVGSVEKRAPLFQFSNPLRRFLRVNLGHAPVVQKFAAAHCVPKMRAPIILPVDVGHRCRDATFSHYSVCFAEQRFAHNTNARALGQRFNRCA